MCYSNVSLFYGVWVTTSSLTFAADAHEKVHPTLLAIDLICLRLRKGELIAEVDGTPKRTVADLPAEIWDMVRQEVIDAGLWDAEQDTLGLYRCLECRYAAGQISSDELATAEGMRRIDVDAVPLLWKRWDQRNCQKCLDYISDMFSSFNMLVGAGRRQIQSLRLLLSTFKLNVVSLDDTWKAPETWQDFDELSAVAIPLHSAPSRLPFILADDPPEAFPQCESDTSHDYHTPSGADLDPRTLILPADADLRFGRLVRSYRLHVVDQVGNTIGPAITTESGEYEPDSHLGIEAGSDPQEDEGAPMSAQKPRWMMWTYSRLCY